MPQFALAAPAGHLKITVGADATTFHPHVNALPVGNAVDLLVLEGLFRMSAENTIVPDLATEYAFSDDGMIFTVKIRTGKRFSNGNPLNAEAVAVSFNQLLDPQTGSAYAGLYASLGEAIAVGEDTVEFHLSEKNGHVLMLLANTAATVIDVKAASEMGAEYGRHLVGSGPYMVDEFIGGERFSLIPNPTYQGDYPATLEVIEFMAVPEDASRMAKAAYAGMLKCFPDLLDQFAFAGKAVLPLATSGSLIHAQAIDYALRPVLHLVGARMSFRVWCWNHGRRRCSSRRWSICYPPQVTTPPTDFGVIPIRHAQPRPRDLPECQGWIAMVCRTCAAP